MNELKNKVEINMNEEVIEIEPGKFELFRQIPDFEKYWIGINGTVLSLQFGNKRELKQRVDKDGYHHVTISSKEKKKSFLVHRLVAEAFLYGFDKTLEVDHIDNNRQNNCVENLQMLTHKENMKKVRGGKRKTYTRLSEKDKQYIRDNYVARDNTYGFKAILNTLDISPQTLKNIVYK